MYLLKKFTQERFTRINEIIDSYNTIQNSTINLIACVSYMFPEVAEVLRFPLSTLPTEGLIENRYFPAYKYMDEIEIRAEYLTLNLFKIKSGYNVNIQPHSGTQANHIVYNAVLRNNDTVISLSPRDGGHISHTKISNGTVKVFHYFLDKDLKFDYDHIEELVKKNLPKLIIAGVSSYPREIDFLRLSEIAKKYNSYLLADISHTAVFIAAGIYKTIFPYVDFATYTMEKNLRGPHGGVIIYKSEFKNKISYSTFPISQGGPIQNMLFGKLVALEILNQEDVYEYALRIRNNARQISETLIERGLDVITGGTDSHIVLVDTKKSIGLTGQEAETLLGNNRILVNKNLVPNDTESPLTTSGIRIGSTTITNLGYSTSNIALLANIVSDILMNKDVNKSDLNSLLNRYHKKINISNEETN